MSGSLSSRRARQWLLGALAGLIVLLAMLVLALAMADADHFRGPLLRLIAARTGREIRVEGSLQLHLLSLTPQVLAERVVIGNPPWMPAGTSAQIGRLSLAFELLPLLRHACVIRRLELQSAALHLLRDPMGRANWQWSEPDQSGGLGAPLIQSLVMSKAQVEYEDQRRHLQFAGTISALDQAVSGSMAPLHIEGSGLLNGRAATFALNGDPLASARPTLPYRFAFAARSSHTRLDGRGVLPHAPDLRALDLTFEAAGEDMKDLYFLTGVKFPDTAGYRLSGRLVRDDTRFAYRDLKASAGQSDLHGSVSIETASGQAKVSADLESQLLRVADLGAHAAGRSANAQATPLLLSDRALSLNGVRHGDAVVNFHAHGLELGKIALHAVSAQFTIAQGVLTVSPLTAALREGKISGRLRFDAAPEVPSAQLELSIADLRLSQFARKNPAQPPIDGLLQGRLQLTGHGSSIHQLAASANGTVTAVLPRGTIRDSFAELTSIDLVHGLGLLLSKNHEDTAVRCGIASFQAHEGTLVAQSLIVDTEPVLITGSGVIHLDSESLDITLRGRPKSRRLLRLDSPVMIRGTLAHPVVTLSAANSIAQTGKALTLGIVMSPLQVLGFVDPGLAHDADCASLFAQARADGAPPAVKPP